MSPAHHAPPSTMASLAWTSSLQRLARIQPPPPMLRWGTRWHTWSSVSLGTGAPGDLECSVADTNSLTSTPSGYLRCCGSVSLLRNRLERKMVPWHLGALKLWHGFLLVLSCAQILSPSNGSLHLWKRKDVSLNKIFYRICYTCKDIQ